jgi:hypothetical protein
MRGSADVTEGSHIEMTYCFVKGFVGCERINCSDSFQFLDGDEMDESERVMNDTRSSTN